MSNCKPIAITQRQKNIAVAHRQKNISLSSRQKNIEITCRVPTLTNLKGVGYWIIETNFTIT